MGNSPASYGEAGRSLMLERRLNELRRAARMRDEDAALALVD